MQWFLDNVPAATAHIDMSQRSPNGPRRLLSLVSRERLLRVLGYMLDEKEFLSPHGIRSLSRFHREHPYALNISGSEYRVGYEPAESRTGTFGGNSNWRGPIWFPINFLIIESLQKFHYYFGDELQVEFPTGSGRKLTLWQIAAELSMSLNAIFLRDRKRPAAGLRRYREISVRPSLAGPGLLLRVFSRRYGCRIGCRTPNGMDCAGCQAHRAERRARTHGNGWAMRSVIK